MNNVIAYINVAGQLIGILGPLALDLALKIKALFETSAIGSVDIKQVGDATIAIDDATMADINQWLAAHNLPTLPTV